MHDDNAALDQALANVRAALNQAPPAPATPPNAPAPTAAPGITIHGNVHNAVNGSVHIESMTQNL